MNRMEVFGPGEPSNTNVVQKSNSDIYYFSPSLYLDGWSSFVRALDHWTRWDLRTTQDQPVDPTKGTNSLLLPT